MHELTTQSPDQTRALGRCLGQMIQKGLTLRLRGELGSGKTCFVQGLAQGLDVPCEYVLTSPTYTLINEYPGRLPLFHIDLYRLGGSADAEMIGLWEIFDSGAVAAVEWSERLSDGDWPVEHLRIDFTISDDLCRRIGLIGCGRDMDNLINGAVKRFEALVFKDQNQILR
ncbi:MAG: tRNA (adenosine(37)-N6)-threonylcarbamoyltransferase complex ATPase subunit type 1 TsaE [Desulfobacteraceae bacterium]|nr:tRNA (adenosine(37)-N6)-threonylcarbamoyltransferase complex ATPase subunit type 1 TsaE [Desulfobacteraceae bacterium]